MEKTTLKEIKRLAAKYPKQILGDIYSAQNPENVRRVAAALIEELSDSARAEIDRSGQPYAVQQAYSSGVHGCTGQIYEIRGMTKGGNSVYLGRGWAF